MFQTRTCILAPRKRIVHVVAKILQESMQTGVQYELMGVRDFERREDLIIARHVQILGPSDLWHTPTEPLPGTNGRGIAYLVTEAPLKLYFDVEQPISRVFTAPVSRVFS